MEPLYLATVDPDEDTPEAHYPRVQQAFGGTLQSADQLSFFETLPEALTITRALLAHVTALEAALVEAIAHEATLQR